MASLVETCLEASSSISVSCQLRLASEASDIFFGLVILVTVVRVVLSKKGLTRITQTEKCYKANYNIYLIAS
jgi:hypothetical protein